MALFPETKPKEQTEEVVPVKVKHAPDTYKGIAIDTKYIPKSSLLQWINGSNWRVTYFSQVLNETQEPTALAINREPAYQQYRKISGMDIKVSQALDISQDDRIRTFSVTGSGHTYPFLVPNVGDMFIANIGDGTLGLFTITSARRETFLKDSVYSVEWKMVSKLSKEQSDNLELKSILTYYYSSSSLLSGCGPFVTEQEQEDAKSFSYYIKELTRRFLNDFYSYEHGTFLVPDQQVKVYDHFVTKAMLKIVSISEYPLMQKVKLLNVMSEPIMKRDTIWDALLHCDVNRMCFSTQRVQLVSTKISRWRAELQAIGYTGIPRFVYPIEPPFDVDSKYGGKDDVTPWGIEYSEGKPRNPLHKHKTQLERDLEWFKFNPSSDGFNKLPILHPVAKDNFYVLSENFYADVGYKQSRLEQLVKQHVNNEPIDKDSLRSVLKCCLEWDNLERFYYYPILIILLKANLK